MEQKVLITQDEKEVNEHLKNGWEVVSVTAQHISDDSNGSVYPPVKGNFCFVLKREA